MEEPATPAARVRCKVPTSIPVISAWSVIVLVTGRKPGTLTRTSHPVNLVCDPGNWPIPPREGCAPVLFDDMGGASLLASIDILPCGPDPRLNSKYPFVSV